MKRDAPGIGLVLTPWIAARLPRPQLLEVVAFWIEVEQQAADTAETKRCDTETSVFICEATRHSSKVNRP
jgi:hypothetical protein